MIVKKFIDSFKNNFKIWTRDDVKLEDFSKSPYWIKNNKKIAKRLLKHNPDLLEFFSPAVKDDWNLVSIAVKKYPSTIEFASDRLRNDIDISKMVLKANPFCLSVVAKDVQNDEEFIKKILLKEPEIISMVTNENILNDKDFIIILIEKDYRILQILNEKFNSLFDNDLMSLAAIKAFNKSPYTAKPPYNYISWKQQVKVENIVEMLKKHYLMDFEKNIQLKFDVFLKKDEKIALAQNVIMKIYEKEIEIPSENLSVFLKELGVRNYFKKEDLIELDNEKTSFASTLYFCKNVVAEIDKKHMKNEIVEQKKSTRTRKF